MKKRSGLLLPFVLSAGMFGLYALVHRYPDLLTHLRAKPDRVENVILFIAAVPAILFLVRLLDRLAFDVFVVRRNRVRAPLLLREIVSITLFVILLAWAMWAIFDYKVTAVLAGGTVLAAVLGLALQETLGNVFAGIALHVEDSFEVGDVIRSGEFFGVVEALRWRGTRLRTMNNNVVIVPNSMLARERVEVFSRSGWNGRILQVSIDVHIPPAQVIEVLTQAASHVAGVSQEMPAFARVAAFGESSIVYDVKYFMQDYAQRDQIDAEIRKAIWYALRRNAIPIAYPVRSVRRYSAPPERPVPDRDEILDRLHRVDVLAPLPPEGHQAIAAAVRVHEFSTGETIIRHGDDGDSMFIIHRGVVSVRAQDHEVARLKSGDLFGEMALLTGEARAADVIALEQVVAIEITKAALQPILQGNRDLAAAITRRVMERRRSLASALAASSEEEEHSVLGRIREYFGL